MRRASSRSPHERDLWVENAVLLQIVSLHPDHLTSKELVVRMEEDESDTGRVEIVNAIGALKRSGLVRFTGEVVEPTYAAIRAVAILSL
jgi:asparagine synthetase A